MKDEQKRSIPVTFRNPFRDLYAGYEAVAIRQIDELPGPEPGLRFMLESNRSDVARFVAAANGGDFSPCPDGVLALRFRHDAGDQQKTVRLKAVFADGRASPIHTIEVAFQPKTDPATGRERLPNNRFRLSISPPIPPITGAPEDWKYPVVTEEERRFAADRWGARLAQADGDYDKAKTLARLLMAELWPHSGRPSTAMKGLPPFEQYARMVSGHDKGFCTSFAAIFECACKCFDLLARRITMCEAPIATHRSFAQAGVNHTTTEVFARDLNQWVLMDLRYYMLGAFAGDVGPLTAAEFVLFLNQPARRRHLKLLVYDPASGADRLLALAACPRPDPDCCYAGWERVFTYSRI